MLPHHPEICLFQPEIPQNAGNIGRLCAATQCRLHLVRPFGFSEDDRNLRRAGLDYWPYLDLEIHDDILAFMDRFKGKVAFFSARTEQSYLEIPSDTELLVFGQETKGLPEFLWKMFPEKFYRIPIYHDKVRSLNLANAVSIVLYHQLHARLAKS